MTINAINKTVPLLMVNGSRTGLVAAPPGVLIASADFETGMPSGWGNGSQNGGSLAVSADTSANYAASVGSIRGEYPIASGGVYAWLNYGVSSLGLSDVYIQFKARVPSTYKGGFKFCKIFGQISAGYSNTTFGISYSGNNGSMTSVSFGDGSTTGNDTAKIIKLDGTSNASQLGRNYGVASISTPQASRWDSSNWGTTWHDFKFHCKYNSGTSAADEVNDGEYYVEIDGVVYVDATGLYNRHYSNKPINYIEFFGYAQSGSTPFTVMYDDIKISVNDFM